MKQCNETEGKQSFEPSEAWLDEYEKQATPALVGRLRRYAASRARSVAKVGGPPADDYYTRELVQDALVDTFVGDLRWDPAEKTLEAHVIDVIRYRTRDDLVRALQRPHISLDRDVAPDTGEYYTLETDDEVALALAAESPESSPELRVVVAETLAAARKVAAGDTSALAILDAIERGATTREDVLSMSALTPEQYQNARKQLTRLVQLLPDSLRRAARGQK